MKELTIEQKAKAYDEAIRKLRSMMPNWERLSYNGKTFLQDLVSIFPELKGNEYESTRKRIIALVNAHGQGRFKESMLAWLEKQGSEPNWCHHKVDLSNCSEEYRKAYYDGWNNCNIQHSQCAWSKEDEKVYQSIIDDTVQENQLDNEQINWFISLKKRIRG